MEVNEMWRDEKAVGEPQSKTEVLWGRLIRAWGGGPRVR